MVQSALIGLKQKKSISNRLKQGRTSQNPRENIQSAALISKSDKNDNVNEQNRLPDEYFPDLDFISVKGRAPLLLPHPGIRVKIYIVLYDTTGCPEKKVLIC